MNLAAQARGLIFPIFDRARQDLVASVFLRVIELDPDYFGGYAGAAQTLATRAIITPIGPERSALLERAAQLADHAVQIEPAAGWTQSSLAWVAHAAGDYGEAYRLSQRAVAIAPDDGHVLDFHGAITLFSGHFDDAVAASDRTRVQGGSNQRFANRNIYAAASFHLGNFDETIKGFEEAASYGDPISAPAIAYHAAALNRLGERQKAQRKIGELNRAWPGAPLGAMLRGIHGDGENAEAVLRELRDLGWEQPEVPLQSFD